MNIISNFKQQITLFWGNIPDRKKQWGMLILAFVVFLFASEFIGINESSGVDFMRGFKDGWNDSHAEDCGDCGDLALSGTWLYLTMFASLAISLPIFILFLIGFSLLFYKLLFKRILYQTTTLNIVTFVLTLLILYNVFYYVIEWLFIKNNAFKDAGKAMKDVREYATAAFSFFLVMVIVVHGFIRNAFQNSKQQAELLQQKSEAEIQALKAQINPHFLFNTLNNLYGTAIVEGSPKTASGIEQLAGIMRHAVEGSKNDKIGIEKEIKFLHDYIEIQSIRFPKLPTISVNYAINWDETPAEIAPLLLMTFIENAFKYGISTNQKSFVDVSLTINNQQLTFNCRNSKVQRTQLEEGTGTGIENTEKRLKLLYPAKHSLAISPTENEFVVNLTIDLT